MSVCVAEIILEVQLTKLAVARGLRIVTCFSRTVNFIASSLVHCVSQAVAEVNSC